MALASEKALRESHERAIRILATGAEELDAAERETLEALTARLSCLRLCGVSRRTSAGSATRRSVPPIVGCGFEAGLPGR